jgi:competence ComEA-like helix-hairpin-helix protein
MRHLAERGASGGRGAGRVYHIWHSSRARRRVGASAPMPYARRELWLLLALAAMLLAGLGVREWRAAFPGLAERVERFDRDDPIEPLPPTPPRAPGRGGRPAAAADAAREPAGPPPSRRGARAAEAPAAAAPAEPDPRPLDLNAASVEQIARLPGVGPGLARRIVEERDRRGRFESSEALRGVVGLGPKKLAALRDLVTTTGPPGGDVGDARGAAE